MSLSVDAATAEVRALASGLGVSDEPTLLADKSNLVLRVGPLVARVAMATSLVRVGMQWLRREVEIARFLDERGAAVTRPAASVDPGPFERGGFVISFWELETMVGDQPDPPSAGVALDACHAALASYPVERLPRWGAIDETRQVFMRARGKNAYSSDELVRLERAWEIAERTLDSAEGRSASFQAVHGDAHMGNVLATARGPVWTDWEDAFVGPIEWDIACLRSRAELLGEDVDAIETMTAAYGRPFDHDLARDLGLARNLQVIAWLAIFAERQPELTARMRARIARLP